MTDLAEELGALVGDAFAASGLNPTLGAVVRSNRPDLADFQCNGAMAAAKAAKRNPREIAAEVADALKAHPSIASVDIAGPGFLNLIVASDALNRRVAAISNDPKAGGGHVPQPRRVMLDFGGPNVAKPMHVGHLRAAIIGDSLQRLFKFLGDETTSDVHLGDWGLQMGLLISEIALERPDLPYFDPAFDGPYPEDSPVTMEDLERLYPQASAKSKADESRLEAARIATAELQAGRPGYRALWRHFVAVTQIGLEREYGALGVRFNLWKGEADAAALIPDMVAELKSSGVAELDDGAWIISVERETDKKDMPPFMLVNSQGASGYHATDLATILDRKREIDPELSLYVVDQRQALHFEQVFRASERAGYLPEAELEHLGFGTMNGTDGKPFKTREGGVLKLHDLISQAHDAAAKRIADAGFGADFSDAERADIAAKVGVAALKFADLSNVRTTNYVFDLDRFMTFEGKTGPYLLYAAVRVKSLLRRAKDEGVAPGDVKIELPAERALALELDAFRSVLAGAYTKRAPHLICEHAYALAQAFSGLYAAAPIMAEKDPAIRGSRLALATTTLKQLETALHLIGLEAPERM